jgi:hypothetical protein
VSACAPPQSAAFDAALSGDVAWGRHSAGAGASLAAAASSLVDAAVAVSASAAGVDSSSASRLGRGSGRFFSGVDDGGRARGCGAVAGEAGKVGDVVAGSGWLGEGGGAAFMATSTEGWNAGSLRGPNLRGDG